ncbi:MAG: hydrolase [Planctomycetota bacterium]
MRRLKADQALLLVVDIQSRLYPHIAAKEDLLRRASLLIRCAPLLGIPILATEQYSKGLGPTIPEVRSILPAGTPVIEKISFSCAGCPEFLDALSRAGRRHIVVVGIESHVCVQQTVRDLCERGYRVFLAADAVGSRNPEDKRVAVERMRDWDVEVSTAESLLFEALAVAGTDVFKQVSALVKEADADARGKAS